MDNTNDVRVVALAQLKQAQQMIEDGRNELAAAHEKIKVAQELIDQSAELLRGNPPPDHPAAHTTGPVSQSE